MDTEKKNLVKVIAIKLPFELQERLLSFPFLHQIHQKYSLAEIHFITPKNQIEVLNLLPFRAYYHEFDEDEIKSIFDVHRFCVNVKIYNVDLFISLTDSFVDACIGIGLRAPMRLGFLDNWKTFVLTHKTPRLTGYHLTENFFSLYSALTGTDKDLKLKVMSRELSAVVSDWDTTPYIAINLSPLRQAAIEEEIIELVNYFENQKIIFFASEDQEKVQLLVRPFLNRLSKKNSYVHYIYKDWIDLAKMLAFARGVITFNGPVASLSAYVGTKTLILYDWENPQKYAPLYFLSDHLILDINDPTLVKDHHQKEALAPRKQFRMDEVFGRAFEFFKLIFV